MKLFAGPCLLESEEDAFLVAKTITENLPEGVDYYFKAGTLALRAQELSRVHKALKALKRLSQNNPSAQNRFIDLGRQVQIALAN